jgi:hypothetical protein
MKWIPNSMKIAQFLRLDSRKKFIPFIALLSVVAGCGQGAVDPEIRTGFIVLVAVVSFISIFTKPILGFYAVAVISVTFSPPIHIGFANLYVHQWAILIALLATISSGLVLQNFHAKIRCELNLPMMLFIGTLLLALAHAPHMVTGIKSFLYIGVLIASCYLVLLSVYREKHLRVFIALLIVTTSVVCLISLHYRGSGRLGSIVLRNPNSFANFLALVIPFCISLFFHGGFQSGKRLLLALSLMLMFISLGFTFSRSAWVGVFTSILALSMLRPRMPIFLLICGIVSAVFLFTPIQKRVFKDISDPGAQYRVLKAKIAYEKFKKQPILGNGLGSFDYEAQFSEIWAYRAHSTLENNYLLMLAEGGIVEFLAFLYLMVTLGQKATVLLRRVKDPFLFSVLLGSVMSVISTLAAGMFEDTLFFPKNNWLIGMFMGLIIVVGRVHEESLATTGEAEEQVRALQGEIV